MILSDLNYLEAVSESTVVEGSTGFNIYEVDLLHLGVSQSIYVSGHGAVSESTAAAYGFGSFTKTINQTLTTGGSSTSIGAAVSASSGFYFP